MRIFVTGATGFIGSAVVQELLQSHCEVLGLARSEAGAEALRKVGAEVHRGSLDDLESLQSGAAAADGVIHTAFVHDFSRFAENCELDRRAIQAMGEVLAGSDRPLIVSSGTAVANRAVEGLATESDPPVTSAEVPLAATEEATSEAARLGVRTMVIRLAPSVHDPERHGLVSLLIATAKEKGCSAYLGEGENRWAAVHRLDAARAYRLALERGRPGAVYNVVGEEGVALKDIASIIGRKLGVPTMGLSAEEGLGHFGLLSFFVGLNGSASSALTREWLDWEPTHAGLLPDLEAATDLKV